MNSTNRSSSNSYLFSEFVMMCTPTREDENILRLLIEKGALVNDPCAPGGRQALHFAAMSNNCELIRILVDLGANLFLRNHRNETPREVAISFRCKEAAVLLEIMENRMEHEGSIVETTEKSTSFSGPEARN